MRTYEDAKKIFLEHYLTDIVSDFPTQTFRSVVETPTAWVFVLTNIDYVLTKCEKEYDMFFPHIISKEGDIFQSINYDNFEVFNEEIRSIDFSIHPYTTVTGKIRCLKKHLNNLFSKLSYENGSLGYRFLGITRDIVPIQNIIYIGSLLYHTPNSLWQDFLMVLITQDKKVIFIPINARNFISTWKKMKTISHFARIRLPVYSFKETESALAYPISERIKPIFKNIVLKKGIWAWSLAWLGYYQFDYELTDEISKLL